MDVITSGRMVGVPWRPASNVLPTPQGDELPLRLCLRHGKQLTARETATAESLHAENHRTETKDAKSQAEYVMFCHTAQIICENEGFLTIFDVFFLPVRKTST